MKQRGWALMGAVLICILMSSVISMVWMDLRASQRATSDRLWILQAQAAAEALIRETFSGWKLAPPAPPKGCLNGRCAWQGDAALARSFWLAQIGQAGTWGSFKGSPSLTSGWPTLPGSQLFCWLETTPSPDGLLVRITALIQDESAWSRIVMQAVWLSSNTGHDDAWISWREVMP